MLPVSRPFSWEVKLVQGQYTQKLSSSGIAYLYIHNPRLRSNPSFLDYPPPDALHQRLTTIRTNDFTPPTPPHDLRGDHLVQQGSYNAHPATQIDQSKRRGGCFVEADFVEHVSRQRGRTISQLGEKELV